MIFKRVIAKNHFLRAGFYEPGVIPVHRRCDLSAALPFVLAIELAGRYLAWWISKILDLTVDLREIPAAWLKKFLFELWSPETCN